MRLGLGIWVGLGMIHRNKHHDLRRFSVLHLILFSLCEIEKMKITFHSPDFSTKMEHQNMEPNGGGAFLKRDIPAFPPSYHQYPDSSQCLLEAKAFRVMLSGRHESPHLMP